MRSRKRPGFSPFVGTRSAGLVTAAFALSLVLLGGGGDGSRGSLEITSVPAAEIYVDGESFGSTPATLSVRPGDHRIALRAPAFVPFDTRLRLTGTESQSIVASLDAIDPAHPAVVAQLAAAHGIDVSPFEAPSVLRGRDPRPCAVLLWPSKDVRIAGVVNFAIEADGSYAGDATLEFRRGRKVLYREAFNPASITTVREIPDEVREHLRVGRTISWGLYFEDHRKPIRTKFRVVKRRNADRQIARLEKSRHMARQSKITRDLIQAAVLENNRLYTEALAANLKVVGEYPASTQPYRGIVNTLRRLDADESELYAVVAQAVGGRGGRVHGGIDVRGGDGTSTGLQPWMPVVPEPGIDAPAPSGDGETPRPTGPGDAGVMPPSQPGETPEPGVEPTPNPVPPDPIDAVEQGLADAEQAAALAQNAYERALADYDVADQGAREAEAAAEAADQAAQAAQNAFDQARQIVENNPDPTEQELEDMAIAGQAAEDAREAAEMARQAAESARRVADQAQRRAHDLERDAAERAAVVAEMQRGLDAAKGLVPGIDGTVPPGTEPGPDIQALTEGFQDAERSLQEAQDGLEAAHAQFEQAKADDLANPSEATAQAVADAIQAVFDAEQVMQAAEQALDAARNALSKAQAQPPGAGPSAPATPPGYETLRRDVTEAEQRVTDTQAAMDEAKTAFDQAEADYEASPSESTQAVLGDAVVVYDQATQAADAARRALQAAQQALDAAAVFTGPALPGPADPKQGPGSSDPKPGKK